MQTTSFEPLRAFGRDLILGARRLGRGRGFTATALLTLAVSIGAAVAVGSVYHSVIRRPLPLPGAEQLVLFFNAYPGAGVPRISNAVPDYFDRREAVPAVSELAIYRQTGRTLSEGESPERIAAMRVTPSLFDVLEVPPARGRAFDAADAEAGSDDKVILSHGLWQRAFGGREEVLGETVRLDGEVHTVIGVMPEGFRLPPAETDLWLPAAFTPEERSDERRHSNSWQMIGRLAPGASVALVTEQVEALNQRNLERFPEFRQLLEDAEFHTEVTRLADELVSDIRPRLELLLGGALFVLLIGAVNLAGLILVRSSSRARDLATRSALGAGRGRLVLQLAAENLVLSLVGGALGLAAGWAGLRLLAALGAGEIPRGAEIALHAPVAAATLAVSLLLGLLFGLIPATQVLRSDLAHLFRESMRTGSASKGAIATRGLLVVVQVAFAFVLLVGAGFLLSSFARQVAIDPGFAPEGVLSAQISLPALRYGEESQQRQFAERLLERLEHLPGVGRAALTDAVPFGGSVSASVVTVEGYTPKPGESVRAPTFHRASPGYFETLGIEVLSGRAFDARDTAESQLVVVVDTWMAEHYWPDTDPVGKRLYLGTTDSGEPEWRTVVGVVEEVRLAELAANEIPGAYYFPLSQMPSSSLDLALATAGDPHALVGPLRDALGRLDPELALYDVATMEERIDESLISTRLPMMIAVVFAAVALFLAAVGIYGMLAYSVVQRTREFGIRLALGESTTRLFRRVLSQGFVLLGVGLVAGAAGAWGLTRFLTGLLYGTHLGDPLVYLPVLALLALVALVASALPAHRATRVDPGVSLAAE